MANKPVYLLLYKHPVPWKWALTPHGEGEELSVLLNKAHAAGYTLVALTDSQAVLKKEGK